MIKKHSYFSLVSDCVLVGLVLFSFALRAFDVLQGRQANGAMLGVAIFGLLPVFFDVAKSARERRVSINLLPGAVIIISLFAGEFGSAIFICLMLACGRIFAEYADDRARGAIAGLVKLRPEKAMVRRGKIIKEIPIKEVAAGDELIVEAGEQVPADGKIIEGTAEINQSSLTGESNPVCKKIGDKVLSSTIVESGSLVISATAVGADTTFEKIIVLVEAARREKHDFVSFVNVFAAACAITVPLIALIIYFFTRDLSTVLSLVIVISPEELAIAIPIAYLVSIGLAARRGAIIKGGQYLDALADLKTILLDKTGTLTRGKMKVAKIFPREGVAAEFILNVAGSLERFSRHPLALAVVEACPKKMKPDVVANAEEIPGRGIKGKINKCAAYCGTKIFLEENKIVLTADAAAKIEVAEGDGYSVILVAFDKKYLGFLALADELRPGAKAAIKRLRGLGVERVIMLTGDNERVAARVAREAGVTSYHAALLPADKQKYVRRNLGKGKVAMVGDGVNDAASLALADVGIAMGAVGSDAAIEAADVALMKDNLAEVPEIVELGRHTRKIAKQDLAIWAVLNLLGIGLALGGVLKPEGAAFYNFAMDFVPILNSFRRRK